MSRPEDPVITGNCSVAVVENGLRFGFTDAYGSRFTTSLTREQAESYTVTLARFLTPAGRTRLVAVLEET